MVYKIHLKTYLKKAKERKKRVTLDKNLSYSTEKVMIWANQDVNSDIVRYVRMCLKPPPSLVRKN